MAGRESPCGRLSLGLCTETSGRSSVPGSWNFACTGGSPADSSCQAGLDSILEQLSTSLLSPLPLYWGLVILRLWAAGHSLLSALTLLVKADWWNPEDRGCLIWP